MGFQMGLPTDLKDFQAVEESRGCLGFLQDVWRVLLSVGAILFLIVVALGWQ